jgi:hypothetical protein
MGFELAGSDHRTFFLSTAHLTPDWLKYPRFFFDCQAGDVVITFVLVRYLLSLGRDTEDTRSMIGRLIGLTMEVRSRSLRSLFALQYICWRRISISRFVQTMVPPLLCAIANLVVFVALPFSSWYIGLNAIQGKLYAFAIMHTLNS